MHFACGIMLPYCSYFLRRILIASAVGLGAREWVLLLKCKITHFFGYCKIWLNLVSRASRSVSHSIRLVAGGAPLWHETDKKNEPSAVSHQPLAFSFPLRVSLRAANRARRVANRGASRLTERACERLTEPKGRLTLKKFLGRKFFTKFVV